MRRMAWPLVALVSAAACAPSARKAQGGAAAEGGAIPESELASRYAKAMCDHLAGCCPAAGLPFDAGVCLARFEKDANESIAPAVLPAGAHYDADAAAACVAKAAAFVSSCRYSAASEHEFATVCQTVFSGPKQPGEPCNTNFDCARPAGAIAHCLSWASTAMGAPKSGKVCQIEVAPKAGDVCGASLEGPDGSPPPVVGACDSGKSDTLTCQPESFSCVPRVAVGAACVRSDDCVTSAFCQPPPPANGGPPGVAKCAARAADGKSCASSDECVGKSCRTGLCASFKDVASKDTCQGA